MKVCLPVVSLQCNGMVSESNSDRHALSTATRASLETMSRPRGHDAERTRSDRTRGAYRISTAVRAAQRHAARTQSTSVVCSFEGGRTDERDEGTICLVCRAGCAYVRHRWVDHRPTCERPNPGGEDSRAFVVRVPVAPRSLQERSYGSAGRPGKSVEGTTSLS